MLDFINSAWAALDELPHLLLHSIKDTINILPFLFISYLVMEFVEHRTSDKMARAIQKSGKLGPLIGSVTGIIPQCGFSTLASSFYAGKIVTMGTLIAVFLSTSDEMLPVMISNKFPLKSILTILLTKFIIAVVAGFVIDLIFRQKLEHDGDIEELCDHEHCQCEKGIFRSAVYHTLHVFLFIFIVTFILSTFIHFIGEDKLASLIIGKPVFGQLIFRALYKRGCFSGRYDVGTSCRCGSRIVGIVPREQTYKRKFDYHRNFIFVWNCFWYIA